MAPDGAAAKAAFTAWWTTGSVPVYTNTRTKYEWIFFAGFRARGEMDAKVAEHGSPLHPVYNNPTIAHLKVGERIAAAIRALDANGDEEPKHV